MGIFDSLEQDILGDEKIHMGNMSYSPAYRAAEELKQQRAYDKAQRNSMAGMADDIYGMAPQAAVNSPQSGPFRPGMERPNIERSPATEGTLLYDKTKPADERFISLIKRLSASGDSEYQDQAMSMLTGLQSSALSSADTKSPNSYKEYLLTTSPSNRSPEGYRKYLMKGKQLLGGGANNADARISRSDAGSMVDKSGNPVRIPLNMTYGQAASEGYGYGKMQTSEEAKSSASRENSKQMGEELLQLVESGKADISGLSGWVEGQRAGSGLDSVAINVVMDAIGEPSNPNNVRAVALSENLSNTVLQALRGAQVGPAEQERVDKQLPRPGQSREVFLENLKLTLENIANLERIMNEKRGTGESGNDPYAKGPKPGWTWED